MASSALRRRGVPMRARLIGAVLGFRDNKGPDGIPTVIQSVYDRDYLHHEDCDCTKPQPEFHVTRTKTGDGSVVGIHQGAIGTADLVMKNAIERDKIAAHEDLVCFEMEAAGVMAITKCLPIRGISDYADGHKNDDWQSYAALAAATYAKELLSMSVQSVSESKIEVAQWALERYVHGAVSKVNTDYPSSVNELQTAQSTHLALVDRYNLVHKLINTRPQQLRNVGAEQTQSIPTVQEIANLRTLRDQLLLSVTTLQKQVNEKAQQNQTHNSRADWEGLKKQVNEDAVQMAEMSRITKNTMHTTSSFLQEFGRETGIGALRRAGIIMKHATEYTIHLEDFLKTHPFSLFGQFKNIRAQISSDGSIPLGQPPTMVEPYRPGLNDDHDINTSSANPLSTQVISIRPRMRLPFLRWLC